MENDFFKDFGQKWKVRNGTVVYQKDFCQVMAFSISLSDSPYLMMNFP